MNLNKFFTFFAPKDKVFYKLFLKAAQNVVNIAEALNELMLTSSREQRQVIMRKIADYEHVGDEITHEIFTDLSANFITPFDREDIHQLASALDDIDDFIYASAKRVDLYKIDEIHPSMIRLSEIIVELANQINEAMVSLSNLGNYTKLRENLVKINSLENHADDVFSMSIAELFENEKDAIRLIKYQEILSHLEIATDKCEDVANVIETIMIKNS